MVREKPISFEEKTYNKFKAEKGFFGRVKTIEDYIQAGNAEPDSDWFTEMFAYFTGFVKATPAYRRRSSPAGCFSRRSLPHYPFLSIGTQVTFEELFGKLRSWRRPSTALTTPSCVVTSW